MKVGVNLVMWILAMLAAAPLYAAKAPEWTVVKTPHFTVLTTGKAKEAQTWAVNLERFRVALGMIMPVDPARLTPVVVVIFPNAKQFRAYKMLQHGKPAAVDGYFARSGDVNAIALAMDAEDPAGLKRIIFHEATHWVSSAREESLPAWMEEGIAEVFSTFATDEKTFMVGDAIMNHVHYLRQVGVPSPAQLVGTARDSIDYDDSSRTGRFYAGSWLLVHWAMFGKKAPGAGSLANYVNLMKTGQDAEAAFATAFHGNYKAVQSALTNYIGGGTYSRRHFDLPAEPPGIEPPRKATEAEVEYALGALLLGAQRPKDSLPHLLRSVALDAGNPSAWEATGFAQFILGNKTEALAAFNRAIDAGSKTGLVWYNRAALQEELDYGEGPVRTENAADFARPAADFRQAIKFDPRCEQAYQGLAGLVYSVEPADPEDTQRLEAGGRRFPGDPWIKAGLIMIRMRAGAPEAAGELKDLLTTGTVLPAPLRELIGGIIEQEKLKVLSQHMGDLQKDRRYAELIAEFDAVLADGDISISNKQQVRRLRVEIDQTRRLQGAVEALNSGRRDEAMALLRKLQEEIPPGASTRRELERVLKAVE